MNDDMPGMQRATQAGSAPNPWLAAGLSFFLPGAGQAFHGRFWKGLLLLTASFLVLPIGAVSFTRFGGWVSLLILVPLLGPWLYSMFDAVREANELGRIGAGRDPTRGAISVTILLLVAFPVVATIFSIITLLLLPIETLSQIAHWTEGFQRALGG
jgi:hypothetical protein